MMGENEVTHDIAIILHSKYSILVDALDMPLEDRWQVCDIEVQLDEFMNKFKDVYNSIISIGLEWYPHVFEIILHEYSDGEYFISIEADLSDIDFHDNKCIMGIINFNLAYNDDRLPDIEDEETEEERIDRLINGDSEDDRPWESGNESLW